MKGFKEFIMRGNIVELAVAVVIGSAFAKVVDTLVSGFVKPLVNAAGSPSSQGLGFRIKSGQENTFVDLSTIINALIVFLITAAVVYFVIVLPMNTFNERRRRGQVEEVEPTEIELLTEIRDALRARR